MAFKILNPVANGFYVASAETPSGSVHWQNLSDTLHGTSTSPSTVAPGGAAESESYLFTELPADVPAITPVSRVELFYEPFTVGCGPTSAGLTVKMLARQGGVDLLGTDKAPVVDAGPNCQSGPAAIKSYVFTSKPGGGAWTVADFQGGARCQFGMQVQMASGSTSTVPSDSKLWLEIEYQGIAPNFDAGRDVGSRIMRERRRLAFTYDIGVPLWMNDAELLDDVTVQYLPAEDPKGQGWLYNSWERGWLTLLETVLNRQTNQLVHHYFYMRDYVCLMWDTMVSEATAGLYGLGSARLGMGQVRTFARASGAWVKENPTGAVVTKASTKGGQYFLAIDGVEKINSAGTIFFSTRTNKLFDSSFIRGTLPALTGWVFEGTGGGNTVAGEDPQTGFVPLFEPSVGGRTVKIVKGTAAEVQARNSTVTSISANDVVWVSCGSLDLDNTKPGQVAIKRVVAAVTNWWNVGTQLWQVGKVWNNLTGSSTNVVVDRIKVPYGVTGGTLEVMLGVDAAASNRTFWGYHAEVVVGAYVSDELIVTTSTAYTVLPDLLSDANDSGSPAESMRVFPANGFVWSCEAAPWWNPSDLAAGEKRVLVANEFDANNSIVVYYSKDELGLVVDYKRAGATTRIVKTFTASKGTFFAGALRITSALAEEGLAANSMTLFVDRVASTSTAITPITMTSTATLKRGHQGAGTNIWDGYYRNHEVTPEVLSNEEIQGKP